MAPAIAHFLVGASLFVYAAVVVLLRYEFPIEHTLWVLPIGGIWGVTPDFHNIAPGFTDTLYAFHNSPWGELFALHYTLDRPAIRAQYHESVFVSIAVFTIAIASLWVAARHRTTTWSGESLRGRVVIACAATLLAGGLATTAFGTAISVQTLLGTVAAVVGLSGVFTGWIIVGVWGMSATWLWTITIELGLSESRVSDPVFGGGVGCLGGGVVWLTTAVFAVPVLTGQSLPVVHWGSLLALLTYGLVFGTVYTTLRGAFTTRSTWTGPESI